MIHGYLRKAGHAVTYGVLYFLWFRAYQGHLHYSLKKAFLWSLGVCLMVALLDEGHQAMLPSRTGRLADVVLDSAGSTLGAMITFAFWTPRSPATPPPAVIWRAAAGTQRTMLLPLLNSSLGKYNFGTSSENYSPGSPVLLKEVGAFGLTSPRPMGLGLINAPQ